MDDEKLLTTVWQIAEQAGAAVMRVYTSDFSVAHKDDCSPVTEADLAADRIIVSALQALIPDTPVISEERFEAGQVPPPAGMLFWLVDPLDGTKEFIKRNDEFTINIGLIDGRGLPVLGVVHAPALGRTWGATEQTNGPAICRMAADGGLPAPIATRMPPPDGLTVFASRSHGNDSALRDFLVDKTVAEIVAAGSSLKFCRIAEGAGDIYPRFGPTCEWDTAAGHAIVRAAGGRVETTAGTPLTYGRPGCRNPHFIVWGQ